MVVIRIPIYKSEYPEPRQCISPDHAVREDEHTFFDTTLFHSMDSVSHEYYALTKGNPTYMQSIVLPSQKLTSFLTYSLKIAFIIIFLTINSDKSYSFSKSFKLLPAVRCKKLGKKRHRKTNPALKKC